LSTFNLMHEPSLHKHKWLTATPSVTRSLSEVGPASENSSGLATVVVVVRHVVRHHDHAAAVVEVHGNDAVEPDSSAEVDLGELGCEVIVGRLATQPEVEADEEVRADEVHEARYSVDGFLQLVGSLVVLGRLEVLGAERAEQESEEEVEYLLMYEHQRRHRQWFIKRASRDTSRLVVVNQTEHQFMVV